MGKLSFKDLMLGKTSAEKESSLSPELLMKGFFDPIGFIASAKAAGVFLFLGYKGSGKSAIGEHLRLTAHDDPSSFVRYLSLGDFPYTSFSKIIKGDLEPEAKYPDAWSWLLLLQLMESFESDQGCTLHSNGEIFEVHQSLKKAGLLPSDSFKFTVQQTVKKSGGIDWKALKLGREETDTIGSPADIPFFVSKLKAITLSIRSDSQHLIVVDGLDELLGKRSVQLESLGSLVYEINRLNFQFIMAGCPAKILLLCRTDIFEILPNANKNKIRHDSGVELNWSSDSRNPLDHNLVRLANHRASIHLGRPTNIFDEYFPKTVTSVGPAQDTCAFLLDHTRHTPRDFITLLNYIQKEINGGEEITEEILHRAARAYSIGYFLPEIRDELNGHFDPEEITSIVALLSALGRRQFTLGQLRQCEESMSGMAQLDLTKVLIQLFECSALGTAQKNHFTFKYRNRSSILDLGQLLCLHRGIWKALNLR